MGKIVRGAKVVGGAFVVAVPQMESELPRVANRELDERFAAPQEPLPFTESDPLFERAEPLGDLPAPAQVDWEQVRSDARALIDTAAGDAEALLRDAGRRAQELFASAAARVTAIEAEARSRAHDQGFNAGRAKIESEMAETVANLRSVVEEARKQRQKVIEAAEPELVHLAMSVAERIVHEQISVDPNVVAANVRQALTRLVGREVVTLRVNPTDLETIRAQRDAIAASSDVEHLRVIEDARVDRGGVVVETDAGTIDAKVSTQIREARRTLQSDVLSPAQAS